MVDLFVIKQSYSLLMEWMFSSWLSDYNHKLVIMIITDNLASSLLIFDRLTCRSADYIQQNLWYFGQQTEKLLGLQTQKM